MYAVCMPYATCLHAADTALHNGHIAAEAYVQYQANSRGSSVQCGEAGFLRISLAIAIKADVTGQLGVLS